MINKKTIQFLKSLDEKRHRQKLGYFKAEGVKVVNDILDFGLVPRWIYSTDDDYLKRPNFIPINASDLERISTLKSPNKVLAIFDIPKGNEYQDQGRVLVLDGINDPGNLGAIIRCCDWFNVRQIICSLNSVDCYHPKVVQSSMGSISRVKVFYKSLNQFLETTTLKKYFATLGGTDIQEVSLDDSAILLLGSESHGISQDLMKYATKEITIPKFNNNPIFPESLNITQACAVFLYRWMS